MLDALIDQLHALDLDREHRALTEHVAVTCPVALDRLAFDNRTTVGYEAQRVAAIQLRVVHELANKLRWLEGVSLEMAEARTRAAVMALMRSLSRPELPVHSQSGVARLLEPAILFHTLVAQLRPWLPPMVLALEPEAVIEVLELGIADYLHPLLRERCSELWTLFHRVREPSRQGPPAPLWTTPTWVAPWLASESSDPSNGGPRPGRAAG